jgi:flavin reductase (DIM6/NTAB) family NADH-FMN oxidoreductase RutF
MQTIDEFYQNAVHMLLEPGPVVLVTTAYQGKNNVMTLSFLTMMQQNEPFQLAFVMGPWDHSYEALIKTGECVVSIPTVDLASTVVKIGNCSGDDTDKFKAFNLTTLPAKEVQAPLIAECYANIECRVVDTSMVEAYNLFILETLNVWTDPDRKERRMLHHKGDGTFVVDGETINLKDEMIKWPEYL